MLNPITEGKFLGATIQHFSITANYNEQSFNLNIALVEDKSDGDDFLLKEENTDNLNGVMIGTPQHFEYNGFTFNGILKSFDERGSVEGKPLFSVVLRSPNEILDAVQVILDGYVGPGTDFVFNSAVQGTSTFLVSNFLNVYGYAEDGGLAFGRSQVSPVGMYWNGPYGVKNCLEVLTRTPPPIAPNASYFGCHIAYRGHLYQLDLSGLPIPPDYYTVGGVMNMSLLELISKFCQDAGVDYILKLTLGEGNGPHTISIDVIVLELQNQLRQLSTFLRGQTDVVESNIGEELTNYITQGMLVGGAVNFLQPLYNSVNNPIILPFWGFDVNGNAIIGQTLRGTNTADDDLVINLNAGPIADIMGELGLGLSYPTKLLELRCALANYDTWVLYLDVYKKGLVKALGLGSAWQLETAKIQKGFEIILDMVRDDPLYAKTLSNRYGNNHWPAVAQRLYEFVRSQAETYYGKQFIVLLPFNIQLKIVPQTFQVVFSDELADAGYLPEGSQALGLNYINENYLLDQTGRFYPFVRIPYANSFYSVGSLTYWNGAKQVLADFSAGNNQDLIIQPDGDNNGPPFFVPIPTPPPFPPGGFAINASRAYVRCEQGVSSPVAQNGILGGGSPIFFVNNAGGIPIPAMVISIPNAIWGVAEDVNGSSNDLAALLQFANPNDLILKVPPFNGPQNFFIHPPAIYPDAVSIALKSNQYVYGPWGKFRTNGKLEFEQDEGLTPWDCGSYDIMNQVAQAKLQTIATASPVLERASFTLAGVPRMDLFDAITPSAPLISSIECSIGTDGVTTRYNLETFVNRIGAFSRENADRLKRIGKIYQQLRKNIRQQIILNNQRVQLFQENRRGFMFGTTYALQQHTPHGVLLGSTFYSETTDSTISSVSSQTYQESVKNIESDNPNTFLSTACMGMEGLLRPFTNNINNQNLSWYFAPDTGLAQASNSITNVNLNPFQTGCDITWFSTGQSYSGLNSRNTDTQYDFNDVRALALRGPALLCGWGYDIQGLPVPNLGASGDSAAEGVYYKLQDSNSSFFPGYLTRSTIWPAGPIDLRWDKFRGMWSSPGYFIQGTISGQVLGTKSTGKLRVQINDKNTDDLLNVYNGMAGTNSSIPTGVICYASYFPLDNKWKIVSVDCST